ncbi:ABC transporter substrate-binding protein [Methylobacterium sp. 37f]|uniref:ABC transporter substrate-binding protein n=1 Tax=Methylobacterium sp. 37f TaxID=2817058 RepID=UPI001FFD8348|nr:ABC transporter substrate-binding protein [Methylobacterium sp. 37f]MCK2054169.1 ABC transporter substrate-binding protein [Methylobacterium sp. 37f]
MTRRNRAALAAMALGSFGAFASPAQAESLLRIAMTATDIPTTTGMPNNGFEGLRFLGYPIFEGLVSWDLTRADRPATLRPGLADHWEQAADDKRTWLFHLRDGVAFHDGTPFDADAVVWNLDRYFKADAPQYEVAAAGITRTRVPIIDRYRKVDDRTVAITTTIPASYFPYMMVYPLMTAPSSFEKGGRTWAGTAMLPAAGTGPFRITRVSPREAVDLARFDGYWDAGRRAKLDRIRLMPIPEANARIAALRSGQVDWIEVPAADAIPSLKSAGFTVTTGSYPHVWPWFYNIGAKDSPFRDVRVRQALNYCVDRDSIVSFLNGTAEPAIGWLKPDDPGFGAPANRYGFDPEKGRSLLAAAGYGPKKPLAFPVMISTSGSGQMLPLPMNEFLQENLKQSCGVEVSFNVVEWQVLLNATRALPDAPSLSGAMALNVSSPTSDAGVMARYFSSDRFPPSGFNFPNWRDETFDAALQRLSESTDPAVIAEATRTAHARLVDDPPWLYVVHDRNPRAMSPRVKGFVSAQSWFLDLSLVSVP